MSAASHFLAFDLGASGGRAVLGAFDGQRLSVEEIHRFPNGPIEIDGHLHWDAPRLLNEIKTGLRRCAALGVRLDGIGIDTWGVDYALLSREGDLIAPPFHYRDSRTNGVMERVMRSVSREEIYSRTGIQFMPINTLYQLASESPTNLRAADKLLMMPDLLNYWLTGVAYSEHTIASTSQMYDVARCEWVTDLTSKLGIPPTLGAPVVQPGTIIGNLLPSICNELGIAAAPVIAPACHDTGCAVAAVPATGNDWAYISSGTWSLVGVEITAPLRTAAALEANLTNEGGVAGTVRLLRNVTGLWLVQECQRIWSEQGQTISVEQLAAEAAASPGLVRFVDPDNPCFGTPCDMPERIRNWCRETDQTVPETRGEIVRCVLESLALKSRLVVDILEALTRRPVRRVHLVGGGVRNELHCQLTADATGRPVRAGPVEATAIGNILIQAMALGRVRSLADIRGIVSASFDCASYEPHDPDRWTQALTRFQSLLDPRGAARPA